MRLIGWMQPVRLKAGANEIKVINGWANRILATA